MFTTASILLSILFGLFWLVALAAHFILLKLLLTPYERIKLHLPAGAWPLLLSITAADTVALLAALPFTSLFTILDDWIFGEFLCNLSSYLKVATLTVTSYALLALMMQCYELVVKSDSRPQWTRVKLGLLLGSIWLLATLPSLGLLTSHEVFEVEQHWSHRENLETFDFEAEGITDRNLSLIEKLAELNEKKAGEKVAVVTTHRYCVRNEFASYHLSAQMFVLLQFLVPAFIVIYLFIKITDVLGSRAVNDGQCTSLECGTQQQQQQQLLQNLKFVKSTLLLTVLFHLLWAPMSYFTLFSVFAQLERTTSSALLATTFILLSEATFFIKPLLLFACNVHFRNALRTIGVPTIDVQDGDGWQVGFFSSYSSSKMEEAGVY